MKKDGGNFPWYYVLIGLGSDLNLKRPAGVKYNTMYVAVLLLHWFIRQMIIVYNGLPYYGIIFQHEYIIC